MLQVTYTVSPKIAKTLNTIESARRSILTTAISPRKERQLVWETTISRLYALERPNDIQVTRDEIEHMLLGQKRYATKPQGAVILSYKATFDYLSEEWLANPRTFSLRSLQSILDLLATGGLPTELPVPTAEVKQLFDYLSSPKDHPVIAAGIAYSQWTQWEQTPFISPIGTFLMYTYLFKAGYDIRRFLCIHHQFTRHPREYTASLDSIATTGSSTTWLEYFVESFSRHLETISERIDRVSMQTQDDTFFILTDRQRAIVALLDNPESTITNRKIQEQFRLSQITASRELGKLTALGKIIPRGKGRSIYYVKGA